MVTAAGNETAHRKVAILIDSLNDETADQLLSQMPLEVAARVREMCENLGEVRLEEREAIIDAFLRQSGQVRDEVLAPADDENSGVELEFSREAFEIHGDRQVSQGNRSGRSPDTIALQGNATAEVTVAKSPIQATQHAKSTAHQRLDFVTPEDVPHLAALIQTESDQIGAVIMSLLEPDLAARVLEGFTLERQTDVLKRLVVAEPPDVEIVSEIVEMVHDGLRQHQQAQAGTGWLAVQAILDRSKSNQRDLLKQQIEQATQLRFSTPSNPKKVEQSGDDRLASSQTGQPVPAPATTDTSETEPRPVPRQQRPVTGPSHLRVYRGESASKETAREATHSLPKLPANAAASHDIEPSPAESLAASLADDRHPRHRDDLQHQRSIESRFDQLQHWPPRALVQLFKRVPSKVMTLALTGAQPRFLNRVLKSLSRREASRLKRDIERSGPVRLADITQAQAAVLESADELRKVPASPAESLQVEA